MDMQASRSKFTPCQFHSNFIVGIHQSIRICTPSISLSLYLLQMSPINHLDESLGSILALFRAIQFEAF